MKKYVYFLLLAVLFTSFIGCANKGSAELSAEAKTGLSAEVKAEMEAAWLKQNGRELPWNGEDGYYGVYNGAVVYLESGPLTAVTEKEVAGETFVWPRSFVIYVYKDGEFYDLETAYENGLLTKKNIKSIAKRHDEYLSERTNRGDYRP